MRHDRVRVPKLVQVEETKSLIGALHVRALYIAGRLRVPADMRYRWPLLFPAVRTRKKNRGNEALPGDISIEGSEVIPLQLHYWRG